LVRCVTSGPKHALVANTQTLVKLVPVFCMDNTPGCLLLEEERQMKKQGREENAAEEDTGLELEEAEGTVTWLVRHVAHAEDPFQLDISVKLSAHSTEDLCVTVPAAYLREPWARSVGVSLAAPPGGRYEPALAPVLATPPPSLLSALTLQVAVHNDGDETSLYLPEMEHKKLTQYAHNFAVSTAPSALVHDRSRKGRDNLHDTHKTAAPTHPTHGGPKYRPHFHKVTAAAAEKERKLELFQQRIEARWKQVAVDDEEERRNLQFSLLTSPPPQQKSSNNDHEDVSDDDNGKPVSGKNGKDKKDAKDEDEIWDGSHLISAAGVLLDPPNPYTYPTPYDVLILNAALVASTGSSRLSVYCTAIENFLRYSELGREEHLHLCSAAEMRQLAGACTVMTYNPKSSKIERVVMANDAMSHLYIVLQGTVLVGHHGAGNFMKSKGAGSLLGAEALAGVTKMWSKDVIVQSTYSPTARREHTAQVGVLHADEEPDRGTQDKNVELSQASMPTLLLAMPLHLVLATCGQVGPESAEMLDYFWKFCRMYPLLLQADFEPLFRAPAAGAMEDHVQQTEQDLQGPRMQEEEGTQRYVGNDGKTDYVRADHGTPELHSEMDRNRVMKQVFTGTPYTASTGAGAGAGAAGDVRYQVAKFPRSTRRPNVIAGSRRRSVGAGKVVAEQGLPRQHLLLIMTGECAVISRTRKAKLRTCGRATDAEAETWLAKGEGEAKDSNDDSLMVETDTGLRLLAGDFWFCDGEDPDTWCEQLRTEADGSIMYPEGMFYLSRGLQVPVYGTHKHTLLAMTPVDIAVVPLTEVSKNVDLFKRLLLESFRRYPVLHERRGRGYHEPGVHSRSIFKAQGSLPPVAKGGGGDSSSSSKTPTAALPEPVGRGSLATKMYKLGIPSCQWPPPAPTPITELQKAYTIKLRQATSSDYPIVPYKATSLPVFNRGKDIGSDAKKKSTAKHSGFQKTQRVATAAATATTNPPGVERVLAKVKENLEVPQAPRAPPGSTTSKRPVKQRSVHKP